MKSLIFFLAKMKFLPPKKVFEENILPFFEVGDQLFIAIQLNSENGNQVCWDSGDVICEDFITFTSRLVDNPRFYHDDFPDS